MVSNYKNNYTYMHTYTPCSHIQGLNHLVFLGLYKIFITGFYNVTPWYHILNSTHSLMSSSVRFKHSFTWAINLNITCSFTFQRVLLIIKVLGPLVSIVCPCSNIINKSASLVMLSFLMLGPPLDLEAIFWRTKCEEFHIYSRTARLQIDTLEQRRIKADLSLYF